MGELEDLVRPKSVLPSRKIIKHGIPMVKWQGKSIEDTTWEDEAIIQRQFPYFSLEDKVVLLPTDNHRVQGNYRPTSRRPKIWRVYSRKKKKSVEVTQELVGEPSKSCYQKS